jgi:hypothetical protein
MRFEYSAKQDLDESFTSQAIGFAVKSTEPVKIDLLQILSTYVRSIKNNFRDLVAGRSLRYLYEVDTDRVILYGFTPFENLVETKHYQ